MFARCHRSMKKSEPAHSLQLIIITENKVSGKCSCVASAGGFCHHFIGLLFYLAHLKQLGFKSVPNDLTCTMVAQRWSAPRAGQIEPQCVDSVLGKKPQGGANYNKFLKVPYTLQQGSILCLALKRKISSKVSILSLC